MEDGVCAEYAYYTCAHANYAYMCVRTFSMRARTCLCLVSVPTRMHTYPVRGEPERRISSAPVLEEVEKQVDGPQDHKKHLRVLAITV